MTFRIARSAERTVLALTFLASLLSIRCQSSGGGDGTAGEANETGGRHSSGGEGGAPQPAKVCDPGATQKCVGKGACEGGQTCKSDGSGWGPCDCGDVEASGGMGGAPASSGGHTSTSGGKSGAGGSPSDEPCDFIRIDSCGSGAKCTLVTPSDPSDELFLACRPDGKVEAYQACTVKNGVDDCLAGYACSQVTGACEPMCESSHSGECPTTCNVSPGAPAGTCEPGCDLLAPNCDELFGPGLICTPIGDTPMCTPAPATLVGRGEACSGLNECGPGTVCAEAGGGGSICGDLCDARQLRQNCLSESDTCLPIELLSGFENLTPSYVGVCVLCSDPACDLGLPSADCAMASPDCAELDAMTGRDYVCSGDGSCVLSE